MNPDEIPFICRLTVCIAEFDCIHNDGSVEKMAAVDKQWDVDLNSYTWEKLYSNLQKLVTLGPGQRIVLYKEMEMRNITDLVFGRFEPKLLLHVIVKNKVEPHDSHSTLTKKTMQSKHPSSSQPCGLENYNNNCFANAVLQCLTATKPLLSYLFGNTYGQACSERDDWCFTCTLRCHIQIALQSSIPFRPEGVLRHLRKFGGDFGRGLGLMFDAAEFLTEAMNQIESNSSKHPTNKEIIDGMFVGMLQSERTCPCGKMRANTEPFKTLFLPIRQVGVDTKTLEQCMSLFTSKGSMEVQCEGCSNKIMSVQHAIREAPDILVITLNRWEHTGTVNGHAVYEKFDKHITCPMELNITRYMSNISESTGQNIYELYAAITHIGGGWSVGHYISYTRCNQEWYKINDSSVERMTEEDVATALNEGYILLYKRKTGETSTLLDEHVTEQENTSGMIPDLLHEEHSVEEAPAIHLYDKLAKGRFVGDLASHQILLDKYIIAEDRLPLEVKERIKNALRFCIPEKHIYIFHVPIRGKIVYDKELEQMCLCVGDKVRIVSSTKKGTKKMATKIHTLLMEISANLDGHLEDQRDLFYKHKRLFGNFDKFVTTLSIVCILLRTTRLSLNISIPYKGKIIGPVVLYVDGRVQIDCSLGKVAPIPHDAHLINSIELKVDKVRFILIVEKETIFTRLVGMRFDRLYNCIILSGKGHSDLATRSVAHKLTKQLRAPIYGLADCNPDGAIIIFNYKYGSRERAFDNLYLTVLTLKWIGLHPTDIPYVPDSESESEDALGSDSEYIHPSGYSRFNDEDYVKIENLLFGSLPLCGEEKTALTHMWQIGLKVDIDSIFNQRLTIVDFLASKIKEM